MNGNVFCVFVYLISLLLFVFSDSVSDEVIGTHFIDLSTISNDGANGKFVISTFCVCFVCLFVCCCYGLLLMLLLYNYNCCCICVDV